MSLTMSTQPLNFGLRLNILNTVEDCRAYFVPHVTNDWDIFFTGISWPTGQIRANVQFSCPVDRNLAFEQATRANAVLAVDTSDRRAPFFELEKLDRRSGVDRRLKSGIRKDRPNTGRRDSIGETAKPRSYTRPQELINAIR